MVDIWWIYGRCLGDLWCIYRGQDHLDIGFWITWTLRITWSFLGSLGHGFLDHLNIGHLDTHHTWVWHLRDSGAGVLGHGGMGAPAQEPHFINHSHTFSVWHLGDRGGGHWGIHWGMGTGGNGGMGGRGGWAHEPHVIHKAPTFRVWHLGDMGTWGHGDMGRRRQGSRQDNTTIDSWYFLLDLGKLNSTATSSVDPVLNSSRTLSAPPTPPCWASVDPVSKSSRTLWAPPLLSISEHVQHVKNGRSTFKRSKIPRTSEPSAHVQANPRPGVFTP